MNAALLTPSKYIKAAEFNGRDVTLTITSVKIEELIREDNTKQKKGIIQFAKTDKGWVLNTTNVKCLIAMWGGETDNWVGKRVTLYPEVNDMSDTGFAIRVRGSPDLAKDLRFTLKLARKKPRPMVLKVTGQNAGKAGTQAEPPHDLETVEIREPGADDGDDASLAAEAAERERQELAAEQR